MTARLRELSARLVDFFRAQPPARRLVLASGVGSLVVVLALAWWVEQPFYRPLFTNLAEQDASAIVEALGAERVPFRLEDGGRAILVPAERLYELRLALASRGLPEGGGVGFELFDRQTLGQTDFLQRLNYQRALQGELGRTISRLAAVVGRDKAIARVAATLEVARVERTEETYDPERTALRTQRTTREQPTGARTGGGAPGVQSNLTNDPAATTEPKGRRDESQSYEVSKVVSHTVAPAGVVKQLSVAVLIDGTYTGAGAARKFTPRPAEELDRLKELVKNAVGFSEQRGDRIELTSAPFQTEQGASGEGVLATLGTWLPALLMRLLAVGLVAAGLFYVVRPLVLGLAARGGEGRAALPEAATAQLTQENLALTQQNPERAAQLVREWLRERARAVEG